MSASPKRVSVIVPTRNRPLLLREALASIRKLEGSDLQFEIIVGDNGNAPSRELWPKSLERATSPSIESARGRPETQPWEWRRATIWLSWTTTTSGYPSICGRSCRSSTADLSSPK